MRGLRNLDQVDDYPVARVRSGGGRCRADRPAGEAAADEGRGRGEDGEAEDAGAGGGERAEAAEVPIQASMGDPVEALWAALGSGDIDFAAPADDIPEDPDILFSFRLPKKGMFGLNADQGRRERDLPRPRLHRPPGAPGRRDRSVRGTDEPHRHGAGLAKLVVMPTGAKAIRSGKTAYKVNDLLWGLWPFFDPPQDRRVLDLLRRGRRRPGEDTGGLDRDNRMRRRPCVPNVRDVVVLGTHTQQGQVSRAHLSRQRGCPAYVG